MKLRAGAALMLSLGLAACASRPVAPGPRTPPPPPGQPVAPPPPLLVGVDVFALKGTPGQGALLSGTAPKETALLLLDGKPVRFDPGDGRFIIGFGRDAPPAALLEARLGDGRLLRLPLAVAPRAWDISSLPTLAYGSAPTGPGPRRIAELAAIEAAKNRNSESDGWRGPFRWPATGRISTLFGSQRIYKGGIAGAYHGGVDVARRVGGPVLDGTPARAPADGVVTLAADRPFTLEGNLVMIDHGFGLVTSLMHLSRIEVRVGDRVSRGQEIGLIGMTGRATGPHLHWGMTWNGARIDPLLLAGPMPGGE